MKADWEEVKERLEATYQKNRAEYLEACKHFGTGFYSSPNKLSKISNIEKRLNALETKLN